jgi:hypothetical protein
MNIFEQASRLRLRFESSKGQLIVEDLWELPPVFRKERIFGFRCKEDLSKSEWCAEHFFCG